METSHQPGQWKSKDHLHVHSQQMKINSVSRWSWSLVSCGAQRPGPVLYEKGASQVPGIQDKPALVRGSLLDQQPEGQKPHCVSPSECRPCLRDLCSGQHHRLPHAHPPIQIHSRTGLTERLLRPSRITPGLKEFSFSPFSAYSSQAHRRLFSAALSNPPVTPSLPAP